MEDHGELQSLLRLKRHETPGPDFVESFLRDFHHRQRAEWERLETTLEQWLSPRWCRHAAAAAMLLLAGWTGAMIRGSNPNNDSAVATSDALHNRASFLGKPNLDIDSRWVEKVQDHQRLDPEDLLLSRHFQSPPMIEVSSDVADEGMAKAAMPVSLELPALAEPNR
jgi:hypothetical protein